MEVADHLVEAGGVQVGVDLGGLDPGMAEQFLHTRRSVPPECIWVAKACRSTCGDTRSGLASPAATAASVISSRAA